jgi:hypothetical protein
MSRVYRFDAARLGGRDAQPYLSHSHVEVDERGVAYLVIDGRRVISTYSLRELLRRLRIDERALEAASAP